MTQGSMKNKFVVENKIAMKRVKPRNNDKNKIIKEAYWELVKSNLLICPNFLSIAKN
jgi:hypothetical protein